MFESTLIFAAAAAEAGEGAGGLISRFGIDWKILIAQMVNFVIVAAILYQFAFKPILATLDERQKKISDGLQYAEEMKSKLAESERQQAEALKKANQEAQQIIMDSKEQAKALYEKQTAETAQKTEDMLRRAEETIAREKDKMIHDVRKEVARLVVQTSGKVLRKELDESEKNRINESAAKELYSN